MPISNELIHQLLGEGYTPEQIRELVLSDLDLNLYRVKLETDLLLANAQIAEFNIRAEMPSLALLGYEDSAPSRKEK